MNSEPTRYRVMLHEPMSGPPMGDFASENEARRFIEGKIKEHEHWVVFRSDGENDIPIINYTYGSIDWMCPECGQQIFSRRQLSFTDWGLNHADADKLKRYEDGSQYIECDCRHQVAV